MANSKPARCRAGHKHDSPLMAGLCDLRVGGVVDVGGPPYHCPSGHAHKSAFEAHACQHGGVEGCDYCTEGRRRADASVVKVRESAGSFDCDGPTLPRGSADRKDVPLYAGLLRYFPAALAAVARVSKLGNDKHNPGQPLHHARGKSMDHADCILRHLLDMDDRATGGVDEHGLPEAAYVAWRALALAQEWLEEHSGAPPAPAARFSNEEESS